MCVSTFRGVAARANSHSRREDRVGRRSRPVRRGIASVLAMLFLMLFSVLAVGFFASTTVSSQVPSNDRRNQEAYRAADSGMAFMRYQLGAITLPAGTTSANLLSNVAAQLGSALNGTVNMGGHSVSVTGSGSAATIYIPAQSAWITLDSTANTQFQATITQSGNFLYVTSRGGLSTSPITRAIQMQYRAAPFSLIGLSSMTMTGSAFTDSYDASQGAYVASKTDHRGAIASNGNITLSNNVKVDGDARCGTGMTTTLNNAASVTGINSPLPSTVSFASVTLPGSYTDLGDISMSSGTQSIPGGVYLIHNLSLSGTAHITWTGPVTLYISSSYSVTQNVIIDTYQNLPVNRTLKFLPTCTTATWSGSNVCIGTLYAPDTALTIGGSVEMFGRIIAKSINNSSTGGMHTDESLPTPGSVGGCIPVPGTFIEVQ